MAGELRQDSLIIKELLQGKDLARKLQIHLSTSSSASDQTREWLTQKILESYETALSFVLGRNESACEFMHLPPAAATLSMSESSPRSLSGSPGSQELLDRDKDQNKNKKRKCLSKWTKQVQASAGRDFEGPLDDGYSWRKYGQKDILGAKYPRGYYRCSHRIVHNCLATKQVQRSDEDPAIFHIIYCGMHTCDQQHQQNPLISSSTQSISSPKQALIKDYAAKPTDLQPREEESIHHLLRQQSSPLEEVFLDFKTAGLKVLSTHDSSIVAATASRPHQFCFPSFTPSSTMAGPGLGPAGCTSIYCTTTTTTSCPSFGNPNCSDHPQVSYLYNSSVHGSSESELAEIISGSAATSSASNSFTVATAAAAAPLAFDPFDNHLVGSVPSFTFDNHWRSL